MFVEYAVQTAFSSFTAPRGPYICLQIRPHGERLRVGHKFLRYSANIGYCFNFIWADWNIFIKLFCTRNGVFANFFNKTFQFDMQNYIAMSSSLNS